MWIRLESEDRSKGIVIGFNKHWMFRWNKDHQNRVWYARWYRIGFLNLNFFSRKTNEQKRMDRSNK